MKIPIVLGAAALLLSACTTEPRPLPDISSQLMPSSPSAPQAGLGYQNPLAGYHQQEPSDPGSWRQLNEEQRERN